MAEPGTISKVTLPGLPGWCGYVYTVDAGQVLATIARVDEDADDFRWARVPNEDVGQEDVIVALKNILAQQQQAAAAQAQQAAAQHQALMQQQALARQQAQQMVEHQAMLDRERRKQSRKERRHAVRQAVATEFKASRERKRAEKNCIVIQCPDCGVRPNRNCRAINGYSTLSYPHVARIEAYMHRYG